MEQLNKKRKQACFLCGPTHNVLRRIPKREPVRSEWIKFLEARPNQNSRLNLDSSRICSSHFEDTELFCNKLGNVVRIMQNAVPNFYTPDQTKKSDLKEDRNRNCIQRLFKENDGSTDILKPKSSRRCESILEEPSTLKVHKAENNNSVQMLIVSTTSNSEISCETVAILNSEGGSVNVSTPNLSRRCESILEESSTLKMQEAENNNSIQMFTSPSTPSTLNLGIARHRPIRYIQDIQIPDLETPDRRYQCISVMQYENKVTKTKIRALKKQNTRLKQKVRNLKKVFTK